MFEELVEFLERDQLVEDKRRPLPRAELSRRAQVALWALRVFCLVLSAMVVYTFFAGLGS
jgi:4-hydroxybenzoate polyprenyltransferase